MYLELLVHLLLEVCRNCPSHIAAGAFGCQFVKHKLQIIISVMQLSLEILDIYESDFPGFYSPSQSSSWCFS